MAFKDFFTNKSKVVTEVIQPKQFNTELQTFGINYDYSQPIEFLNKTNRGYLFGVNGMFPQELNRLYNQSPLHSAIINFKKLLTTGNGYDILGAPVDTKGLIALNQLTNQFDSLLNEMSLDLFMHSRICLKITWNSDNTRIIKVERISPEKIHISELNDHMEPIEYYYNWDWSYQGKYPTVRYPKFDKFNKKDRVQLMMYQVSSPGMRLYAEPSYQSALNWVVLDSEMSTYHKANITNSVNPSLLIQYFEKPGTQEEKRQVLNDLNGSFAGARKTGRSMITFSDGKDLAPTVTQMEANKLDKTFLSLTDTIQRQISYSHQIDPQLLGLKTPGSLGNSGDFLYAYNLFNQTVIQPAQKDIELIINDLLTINGITAKIKLKDTDINKINPTIVVDVPVKADAIVGSELKTNEPVVVNDNLKNLTGKQNQSLLRIIRQYGQGKLTKDQASLMLKSGLGMSNEEVELMLAESED